MLYDTFIIFESLKFWQNIINRGSTRYNKFTALFYASDLRLEFSICYLLADI